MNLLSNDFIIEFVFFLSDQLIDWRMKKNDRKTECDVKYTTEFGTQFDIKYSNTEKNT